MYRRPQLPSYIYFLLAGLFVLTFAANAGTSYFTLQSQAAEPNEIRGWFDPNTIVAQTYQPVQVPVYVSYTVPNKIISSITMTFKTPESINVHPANLEDHIPFTGTKKLQDIEVTALQAGTYQIEMIVTAKDAQGIPIKETVTPLTIQAK